MGLKAALLLAALMCGAISATDADAHGRRGRVGVFFGFHAPLFYPAPYYYHPYPRYYYPPTVVIPAPSAPPVYIEQNPPAASAPPSQGASDYYWYYCPDSQTYYPYVQTCASQWQQVVPRSGPPS
jgi:hypothetical protein